MWLRRLSLFGFGILFILSCTSSHHHLFVGFYPPSRIVLLSPPLPYLPFRKMEEWLHYFQLCPGFPPQECTACASSASDRVMTALDTTPAPRRNIEHWDFRGSTLLPGWYFSETSWKPQERKLQSKQNQLGIMTIHPSHAYQHGSSRGLQNDGLPASAGSQVMMSLKSVACDSRVKVVEFPLKHLTEVFVDGTRLTPTWLLTTEGEGQHQPLGPST